MLLLISFKSVVDIILNNYVALFELIGLLVVLGISAHAPKKFKLYTRIAIFLLMTTIVVSVIEHWTQSHNEYIILRSLLTACKYTLYPAILISIIQLNAVMSTPLLPKWNLLFLIPFGISVPFFFTSQWTHIIFYIDEANEYVGNTVLILRYWPYIVFGFYLVCFVTLNVIYLKNFYTRDKIIMALIIVGSLLFVILSLINDEDNYTSILASSLVFYFLFLYIHLASIDPLTGLRNRQTYYQDIKNNSLINFVVSIDMNGLKTINDTQGHAEGDRAIKTIALVLLNYCGKKGTPYRIGGDEFVILYTLNDEELVKQYIDEMKAKIAETPYRCAFGYASNLNNQGVENVLKEADALMYKDKAESKKQKTK